MTAIYRGGWLPDPVDARDLCASSILDRSACLPDTVNWEQYTPNPYDQINTSSCVAQGGCGAFVTRMGIQTNQQHDFEPSVSFLYHNSRRMHGRHDRDEGTGIRYLMKSVALYGVCPSDAWPFDPNKINVPPPWNAYRKALDQRWVTGYYRVDSWGDERIADIKRALAQGHIPAYAMNVDVPFTVYSGGIIQRMSGPILGGHCMFLYGYHRNECWFSQNSWSSLWGERGRFRMSLNLTPLFRDIWIFTTVPKYSGT